MKKLIIIYGLHLDKIQNHTTEERLIKILNEQSFTITNDTEIKYYTTKQ